MTSEPNVAPAVDEATLLTLLGHDRQLALELFEVFTHDMRQQRPALHAAALAGDVRALVRLAHRLKGSTMNLGCPGAANMAADLEQHAAALDPVTLESTMRSLDAEIERCLQHMVNLSVLWQSGPT